MTACDVPIDLTASMVVGVDTRDAQRGADIAELPHRQTATIHSAFPHAAFPQPRRLILTASALLAACRSSDITRLIYEYGAQCEIVRPPVF